MSERPFPDADGSKLQDMYRGKCYAQFKGMNLFGDWYSGTIFKEDDSVTTDDGYIRMLRRTSAILHQELKYISVYELEIDVNSGFGTTTGQGVDPVMMLTYSLNGGNTFETEEFIKLGPLGEYDFKVQKSKLGTARNWVIDFKITDPVNIVVMQSNARISVSSY
jgi:hypothetical protein